MMKYYNKFFIISLDRFKILSLLEVGEKTLILSEWKVLIYYIEEFFTIHPTIATNW